ncbi:MAG: 5'/3'-nucleotidase SurE [Pseudomonadota bacterium]|nr:5'/3'-nucleotidase SurE [Pseudomonadota bacterium]MDE3038441.1 5'/3'-nucleotidase SurE [Pseudomonadota bacterium]
MRILVTNDDGIHAPGLKVLENIARALSKDVWVVAPEVEQSGASHSLTLHLPVRARKIAPRRFAVSGTPTDCVLLGLKEIIPSTSRATNLTRLSTRTANHVHLILSGVNRGSNVGDDVTYSGTVAAAMEGAILGVPSIALSLLGADNGKMHWRTAQRHAPPLIKKLIKTGWPGDVVINVNFPECPPEEVKGVRVCRQGKRLVSVRLTGRIDPKGRPYFWIGGEREDCADAPGTDIDLLQEGYVTVTPLTLDLTDDQVMLELKGLE